MPAAVETKDGSPQSMTNTTAATAPHDQSSDWPFTVDVNSAPAARAVGGSGSDGGDGDGLKQDTGVLSSVGAGVDEEAGQLPSSSPGAGEGSKQQLPWFKTRKALISFAVGGLLLVVLVVLLVLGLLGYLRKVGPFASLIQSSSKDSTPANPLSTIPLMSDPFATMSAYTVPSTPTPTLIPTLIPTPLSVSVAAAVPTPTNLPTTNAVRFNSMRMMWIYELWAGISPASMACSVGNLECLGSADFPRLVSDLILSINNLGLR